MPTHLPTMGPDLARGRRRSATLLSCFHDNTARTSLSKDLNLTPTGTTTTLPPKLYRIQHSHSRARFDSQGDLTTSSLPATPTTIPQWRSSLTIHLHRSIRSQPDSPFISTYNNIWRALEFAEELARKRNPGEANVVLYEIDTGLLEDTAVFHLGSALRGLRMEVPGWVERGEFLLLRRVPKGAMREVVDVSNPLGEELPLLRLAPLSVQPLQPHPCELPDHRVVCLTCLARKLVAKSIEVYNVQRRSIETKVVLTLKNNKAALERKSFLHSSAPIIEQEERTSGDAPPVVDSTKLHESLSESLHDSVLLTFRRLNMRPGEKEQELA